MFGDIKFIMHVEFPVQTYEKTNSFHVSDLELLLLLLLLLLPPLGLSSVELTLTCEM